MTGREFQVLEIENQDSEDGLRSLLFRFENGRYFTLCRDFDEEDESIYFERDDQTICAYVSPQDVCYHLQKKKLEFVFAEPTKAFGKRIVIAFLPLPKGEHEKLERKLASIWEEMPREEEDEIPVSSPSIKQLEQWDDEGNYGKIVASILTVPEDTLSFELIGHLARAYTNLERYADAYALLTARRAEGERDALWNWRMGLCLYETERPAEAIPYLERAIALGDSHPQTARYLRRARNRSRNWI